MVIGILSESSYDSEPLKEIIKKFPNVNQAEISFIVHDSNTGIYADMTKAAALFFENSPSCDFAIFLNDLDDQPERCRRIRSWATNYQNRHVTRKIIVGCPNPSFEQWFVNEENAIKRVLSLDSTEPLPYSELKPKSRVEEMIYENANITITKKSAYIDIAKHLNLIVLGERDASFKRFYEEMSEVLGS